MSLAAAALVWGLPATVLANQPPPGVGGMPGAGPAGPGAPAGPSDDKDGPAEAAPKDKGALAPVVPVPAQPEGRRRAQLFELHGYFRTRADYFHRLDLNITPEGLQQDTNKFFLPPAETPEPDLSSTEPGATLPNDANCTNQLLANGVSAQRIGNRCARRRGTGGANLRLRLEPTIHVTDTVKVHAQVDMLDNLVLGSTPDAYYGANPWAPIDLFTRTQLPPVQGTDSLNDSIVVKRAWGEVRFGFGLTLEVGRMPNHWGMGLVYNDGNGYDRGEVADITRMVDTDYGDSVDSVRASFDFGADKRNAIQVGLSYDWAASGPTTAQLFGPQWESGNLVAQTFSAEKYDNVHQVSAWIARRDDPSMLRRKLSAGVPVVNYGLKSWLRWQTLDAALGYTPGQLGQFDQDTSYSAALVHRRAWTVTPDLWLRINWRTLRIEMEGAMVAGRFRHAEQEDTAPADLDDALATATGVDDTRILQFGYALEFKYGLFDDRFHIGLDHGIASGDSTPPNATNYADAFPGTNDGLGGGSSLTAFRFNPAYVQDMLLFKELLGTVSNAGYVKPWAAFYFFQKNFSARLDIEFAGAMNNAGTLAGNKSLWGLELAGALRYHDNDDPIFVQVQYGAMFPFGAFEPEVTLETVNGPSVQILDAKAAQTVQGQIGIRF